MRDVNNGWEIIVSHFVTLRKSCTFKMSKLKKIFSVDRLKFDIARSATNELLPICACCVNNLFF